jgi:hypothetical protein
VTDYIWHPLTPSEAQAVFAPLAIDWWIAGGVAIDLFVGRTTRAHGDVDVAVLRRDVLRLAPLLAEWDVCIAHSGGLTPWDGTELAPEHHQFWARRPWADAWSYEILLEHTESNDWLYRRDTRVRMPLARIGRRTSDGLPYLAPEVCLLYKSPPVTVGDVAERNAADFDVASPLLDERARTWLRDALPVASPGHPWVARL